jgi:hypothetical protein
MGRRVGLRERRPNQLLERDTRLNTRAWLAE